MDPKKFQEKTKKVAGTTKVDIISRDFLDPDYEVEVLSNQSSTPTGLLEIARLKPKKSNLPTFIFRWDENGDQLDVDIIYKNRKDKKLWKELGYKGHHTRKISGKGKVFEADIKSPVKNIFKGRIDVGLFIQIAIKDSGKGTESIKVVHKKVKIEDKGKGIDDVRVNRGD